MSLLNLKAAALKSVETLTFKIGDVETKVAKTGKVGFKATCANGKVITFWDSTMEKVVEATNTAETEFRVKPGVNILEDGGLIPADAQSTGFWG